MTGKLASSFMWLFMALIMALSLMLGSVAFAQQDEGPAEAQAEQPASAGDPGVVAGLAAAFWDALTQVRSGRHYFGLAAGSQELDLTGSFQGRDQRSGAGVAGLRSLFPEAPASLDGTLNAVPAQLEYVYSSGGDDNNAYRVFWGVQLRDWLALEAFYQDGGRYDGTAGFSFAGLDYDGTEARGTASAAFRFHRRSLGVSLPLFWELGWMRPFFRLGALYWELERSLRSPTNWVLTDTDGLVHGQLYGLTASPGLVAASGEELMPLGIHQQRPAMGSLLAALDEEDDGLDLYWGLGVEMRWGQGPFHLRLEYEDYQGDPGASFLSLGLNYRFE